MSTQTQTLFRRIFAARPDATAHAPGRVNLIGDHTDYNDGYAMPLALQQGTQVAFATRDDGIIRCVAADFNEQETRFDINAKVQAGDGWQRYVRGAAAELRAFAGHDLRGADMLIQTELPIGAGLSSSAALEVAVLRALCSANDIAWRADAMAKLARRAEHVYAGVQCGILDQLCVAHAKANPLLLDCRAQTFREVALPTGWTAVAVDSGTRRELQTSAYNARREECAQAAAALGVSSLRDASADDLSALKGDSILYRRARHVTSENARVLAAAAAFANADADALGAIFAASHRSLRDDFEVGGAALDAVVAAAVSHSACIGARQTGAGFAGCVVAVVAAAAVEGFVGDIARKYSDNRIAVLR